MNRKFVLWVAAVGLMMPCRSLAQGTAGKIGLLNVVRVITENAEGKQAMGDFEQKVKTKRDELDRKNNEIQELQKQLQSQARTLNDDSRAALTKSIDTKTTELQRGQDDAQKEFGQLQNEILGRIGNKVAPFVQAYAKEHNFTIIVDISGQNASGVIYFDPANEITDDIIKRVDAAQAPAAPAASKPK